MDALADAANEIREIQAGMKILDTSIGEIEQTLEPCRALSLSMFSGLVAALEAAVAGLEERKQALQRIEYSLEQARGRMRELRARGEKVGQGGLLSVQKEKLSALHHAFMDLRSDVEAIGHFNLNFNGRLARLKGA